MKDFDYMRATSCTDALALTGAGGARLLAGGTDLLGLMEDEVETPERLIDIKRVDDLDGRIEVAQDASVRIGALATLADIAEHEALARRLPLLVEAAEVAASPQIRAAATLAGNLLQRPRCWYFRNRRFHCWLQGGEECPARAGRNDLHAIFPAEGASPCCAVHPSDLAPCLMALDAQLTLRDARGREQTAAVADFFREPTPTRRTETVLADQVVTEVRVPPLPEEARTTYRKAMARRSFGFALAGVAAVAVLRDGHVADVRVVLAGVAGVPRRARALEAALQDTRPSAALLEAAAGRALEGAEPLAHNAYKVPLTRGLVQQALEAVLG